MLRELTQFKKINEDKGSLMDKFYAFILDKDLKDMSENEKFMLRLVLLSRDVGESYMTHFNQTKELHKEIEKLKAFLKCSQKENKETFI